MFNIFAPANSDVDFLLEPESPEDGLNNYFGIKDELETLLKREVNLAMSKAIGNRFLKESIFSRVKKCYDA